MMSLLLLSSVAGAADEAQVLVELTISEIDNTKLGGRLEKTARCMPAALGGADAVMTTLSALDETPWLSVFAAPSILTLDHQPAAISMGGGTLTELSVTPRLDGETIQLTADLRVEDAANGATHGTAEMVVASGQHTVWPIGDLVVTVRAYTFDEDGKVDSFNAERESLVVPLPSGKRARRRAIDAALAECPQTPSR